MIKIGLRDARAHFGRFVMSIIAIALGVSFVVGSFCFREMMNNQVSDMMGTSADHDVYVRGSKEVKSDSSGLMAASSSSKTYNTINVDLASTIGDVKGVKSAEVVYSVSGAVLVGKDGAAVSTMGAPTLAVGFGKDVPWRSATFTSGTYPTSDDEIALHSFAAEKANLKVGDKTKVVYPDGPKDVTVTGIFDLDSSLAGAIIIDIPPSLAKTYATQQSDDPDKTDQIGIYGNLKTPLDEQAQQELADRINKALPAGSKAHAITGNQLRDESTQSAQEALGFVQPLILIFAVIALFVGSFIIANTFSMIVRESMRGYAVLRSIGASPAQVFTTVIVQAIVLGVVGSGIGIGLGWGMVKGIVAMMGQMGTPMTGSSNPSVSDMLVGLAVGLIVTLIGAALPASRAAMAPPIQAMNETVNPEKPVLTRGIIGTTMIVVGALTWAWTCRIAVADGDPTLIGWLNDFASWTGTGWPLGVGAALIVIGVIVAGPAWVSPAGAVLGWIPAHVFQVTGRLATRNLSRQKRRTSNTAAALFVGVAIVSCLSVVATSAKASVNDIVDTGLKADFSISSAASGQIPDNAVEAIKGVDGLKSVSSNRMIFGAKYDGKQVKGMTFAAQDSLFTDVFAPEIIAGDANKALRGGELVVGEDIADDQGWKVGDTVKVSTENTTVDEEATAQAQADYQTQVQAQIQSLTEEAQKLALAGDAAGAQAKSDEIQQVTQQAQNVDPATLVKTKQVTVTKKLKVGAIISNSVYRSCVFVNDDLGDQLGTKQTMFTMQMYLVAKPGENLDKLEQRIKKAVKPYYVISVMNRDEYKSTMGSMVDQILLVLYALLALSIVIAIFGIVNTLALSVSERTKEIGLLRAIGTSRGQVRGMLGIEASIIAVFGTVMGMVVGVAAGAVIRAVYEADGLSVLSIPWDQLGVFLVLSILVGLIASVSPASRALKQPVLDAVASE
ncbi:FtsX-like permease family protein [Bifidobacterium breve]|uniref:ABC transporter permease n=1 Tax=Bifidobacterium breve TaxID=1685 RepID=UPI0022B02006|nr:FtsX-like permease family protein [Bifidobacterium breve]MCZ4421748.1 FtsX-like permease family protein [Bifidobacterium breve]MCZ4424291.1 FtsX-like permease family protein [Bifidobacterium breve]